MDKGAFRPCTHRRGFTRSLFGDVCLLCGVPKERAEARSSNAAREAKFSPEAPCRRDGRPGEQLSGEVLRALRTRASHECGREKCQVCGGPSAIDLPVPGPGAYDSHEVDSCFPRVCWRSPPTTSRRAAVHRGSSGPGSTAASMGSTLRRSQRPQSAPHARRMKAGLIAQRWPTESH
mmetsp:Transcript_123200/g.218226  ORF Transcript_123200/g.218226 Transcript_123200/m.218226 type:complete len:177 (-) Transcript_123200:120-650(-)